MIWNHVHKALSAYLHGELSPAEMRRVAEHLRGCEGCRAEFEEIQFGARMAQQMAMQAASEHAPASLWNELESALDPGASVFATMEPRKSRYAIPALRFAAATLALALLGVALWLYRQKTQPAPANGPSWEVTRLDGRPAIGNRKMDEKGQLPVGEWLTTDKRSRAQISVGQIGEVRIEPESRVRLIAARDDNHRLALARGKLEAFIWAPPRKFYVDTPSAVAVDLGCSYTLEVNDDGRGLLHVTLGWVAFEWRGIESFVPADAMCVTRPGLGPGTPYFSDATGAFQNALAGFDGAGTDGGARAAALDLVLAEARQRDALTLWHLLARTAGSERGRVYDRLAELLPPPPNVTREGVLAGDHALLDAWWGKLGLGDTEWWRMWKAPLPSEAK